MWLLASLSPKAFNIADIDFCRRRHIPQKEPCISQETPSDHDEVLRRIREELEHLLVLALQQGSNLGAGHPKVEVPLLRINLDHWVLAAVTFGLDGRASSR
jgi:hypothetical protein